MPDYPPGERPPEHRIDRYCDTCRAVDNHPRHIHCGPEGMITFRHLDCCADSGLCPDGDICGAAVRASGRGHGDALTAWLEGRMAAIGPALTAWLQAGAPVMGGASGLDQNRVIDMLQVIVGYSAPPGGTATLAHGFVAGASNQGHIRLMTVNGNSVTPGTELSSSGSYVAGTGIVYTTGTAGSFAAAVYGTSSGTISNGATLSQAGMPAATIAGIEIWDSTATPVRWPWGSLASSVTTNSGDTLSFAAAAIVETLVA